MDDRDVAARWNESAQTWTQHVRAGYDSNRVNMNTPAFVDFIGDISGLSVLDAGCGEGTNTRLFAQLGAKMTGIDISEQLVREARATEVAEPLGISYEIGSVSDMPLFADGRFDAVLSTLSMMDVADYPGAIHECYRVLRPGGMLAFSTCHSCFNYSLDTRQWARDTNGECTGVVVGDYFRRATCEYTWRFRQAPKDDGCGPMTTINFDRTLADYFNPLGAAGFIIEQIDEPRATDGACRADPSLRKHQLIPHTLLVRARKPSR